MTSADIKALEEADEVELTTTGRVTGREISHPVWFVRVGTTLYLVPVKGSDSDWYRNVLKHPTLRVEATEASWRERATPITDPAKVNAVVEKFRDKYGADEVKKYYSKLDVAVRLSLGRKAKTSGSTRTRTRARRSR